MPNADQSYTLKHLTPVIIVDAVEPGVAFWTDKLGFVMENSVPGPDGKLVFASVKKDDVEVMYQTRASVEAEAPGAVNYSGNSTSLFITVPSIADLDTIEKQT